MTDTPRQRWTCPSEGCNASAFTDVGAEPPKCYECPRAPGRSHPVPMVPDPPQPELF